MTNCRHVDLPFFFIARSGAITEGLSPSEKTYTFREIQINSEKDFPAIRAERPEAGVCAHFRAPRSWAKQENH